MTAIVSYGLFTVNSGLRFLSTNEEIVATRNLARPRLLFKLGRLHACSAFLRLILPYTPSVNTPSGYLST